MQQHQDTRAPEERPVTDPTDESTSDRVVSDPVAPAAVTPPPDVPADEDEPSDASDTLVDRDDREDRVDPDQPSDAEPQPVDDEGLYQSSAADEVRPPVDNASPVVDDTTPAVDGSGTTVDESDTAVDDSTRAAYGSDTTVDDSAPAVDSTPAVVEAGSAPMAIDQASPESTTSDGSLWTGGSADRYRDQWRELQLAFVDDPKAAVERAHELVGSVLSELGSSLTRQQDTEQMRLAMRHYRDFVDNLLNI